MKASTQPTALFMDTCLVFGRYITVRNIETIEDEGERVPVYKNLDGLMQLIKANPTINDFTFDHEHDAWTATEAQKPGDARGISPDSQGSPLGAGPGS